MIQFNRTASVFGSIILLICAGCVTAPGKPADGAIASEFSDDSLDVLFATEFPVASKEEALAKAALAYRETEFDKAQFYLVRALKFDVTDTGVLVQIGNLHIMQGNTTLAARAFNYALQQDPDHAASIEGLGLLYFRSGNNIKAKELLEMALSFDAQLWRSHNALGVIADRNRDYDNALTHYDAALELQPNSDSILINRGYSRFLNKQYHDASLDFYEVAARSGNSKAWRNLAMVYAHQGWYKSSLDTYLEVLDPAAAHNEVGAMATDNGDIDDAWFFLNEAIRLSPTYFASAEKNIARLTQRRAVQGVN